MPETAETPQPNIQLLDLSSEIRRGLPSEINVAGDSIGAKVWPEMLQKTKETQKEYGTTVWKRGKNIKIYEIVEGNDALTDTKTGEVFSPRVKPSAFKDYFRGITGKKIAYIHTHPAETNQNLPAKLRFSRSDIKAYINGGYQAMIMLDTDGVHMLTGFDHNNPNQPPVNTITNSAYENVAENSQTPSEVRIKIAQSLNRFGIRYYLSPNLKPTEDGIIQFKDVCSR